MVDIQNTSTHEIGHLLGLDHSSNDPFEEIESIRTATMYYATNPGVTSGRSLEFDDILGMKHLYPQDADQIPDPDIDGITPTNGDNSNFLFLTTQGEEIPSLFDLRGVKIGVYDVVVSNAYGKEAKLDNAFEVKGNPNVYYNRSKVSYIDGGGCGLLQLDNSSSHSGYSGEIILLAITMFLFRIFNNR